MTDAALRGSHVRGETRAFRWLRLLALVVLVLVLLPYLIAPFYRFVDPVSTTMLWRWMRGQRVERTVVPLDRWRQACRAR